MTRGATGHITSHTSRLTLHVSRFTSGVWRLTSHVSRLTLLTCEWVDRVGRANHTADLASAVGVCRDLVAGLIFLARTGAMCRITNAP